jgi:hypothetical protein
MMLVQTRTFWARERRRGRSRAFTLMETALATVIVGVGCVSMLALLGAGTQANSDGTELTTGMNLASNIREGLTGVYFTDPTTPTHWGVENDEATLAAYDDLDDFDGKSFSPPIDARRNSLGADYSTWTQSVKVESVRPDNLSVTMAHLTLAPELRPTSRVTVTVFHNNRPVFTQSWIVGYSDPSAP